MITYNKNDLLCPNSDDKYYIILANPAIDEVDGSINFPLMTKCCNDYGASCLDGAHDQYEYPE